MAKDKFEFPMVIKSKCGNVTLTFDDAAGKWTATDKSGANLGRRKKLQSLVAAVNGREVVRPAAAKAE